MEGKLVMKDNSKPLDSDPCGEFKSDSDWIVLVLRD